MKPDFIKAAIIGHPVGHSKSPLIHGYWLKKYGIAGSYEAIDVAPADLPKTLARLVSEDYAGFNVTLPYKQAILQLCDGLDMLAKSIGAVNLVSIENGLLMGSNSDGFGFVESIRHAHKNFDFKAGPALVLGAGGATRAIIHALLDAGAPEIILVNRTLSKAEIVAKEAHEPGRIKVFDWAQRHEKMAGMNLLVNTTSLGMDGQPDLDLSLEKLGSGTLVADIVYKPLQTKLLVNAAQRGNKTVNGIGMLLHQARPAFQAWFGIMPEIDAELERLVGA